MIEPDFITDLGSPNAYLVHKVLPEIERRTGVRFRYRPCLLGGIFKETGNQSPFFAFADIKHKLDYERLEIRRYVAEHKLDAFKFNSHFPMNTLTLMRMAAAVELDAPDQLRAFFDAGFAGMWEQDRDFTQDDVIRAHFTEAGFDADRLLARTSDTEVKAHLIANTQDAVVRGVFGMPTIFVGREMFYGKERLAQIEAEIQKQLS